MKFHVLRLLAFACLFVSAYSWKIRKPRPNTSAAGAKTTDERTGMQECTTLGCVDCHSWCPRVVHLCSTVQKWCRKTCGFCAEKNKVCKDAKCEHRCELSADGATATCGCFEGFKMNSTGKCVDIDECTETPGICSDPAKPFCKNTVGSYMCHVSSCPREDVPYYERKDCCKTDNDAKCGISATSNGRIIGGKDARISYWPWQAYLYYPNALCGGTLISDRWILTAAHCLGKGNPTNVILGADNITDTTAHTQTFTVVESVIHPDYQYPKNDIALIKIDRAPIKSLVISPACLPGGESPPVGTKCFVTGYGTLASRGDVASILQEVDVPIVDTKKCKKNYAKTDVAIDEDAMICAGYDEGKKDACQGDSGGPLVCQRCSACNWYVAGVVSFGKGCGQANYYGVYANVVNFEKWISETIEKKQSTEYATCNKKIDPVWGDWKPAGVCDAVCGGGKIEMRRECKTEAAGFPCTGEKQRFDDCNMFPCAEWSETTYGECSVSCGDGLKHGVRTCNVVDGSTATCDGDALVVQTCNNGVCPGATTDWSECSATCGGGFKNRFVDGTPEQSVCNDQPCPEWSDWSEWTECSVSCGTGEKSKERFCTNGRVGDVGCEGETKIVENCNTQDCPTWGEWSDFGACTVTCGGGIQLANRQCVGGKPGDIGCEGETEKSQDCNTQECPTWGEWTNVGSCTVTCGTGGMQQMKRECLNGNVGDIGCHIGGAYTYITCNGPSPCPYWTNWSAFSACSATCGDGKKTRTRQCVYGKPNESGCPGSETDTIVCNEGTCGSATACAGYFDDDNVECHKFAFTYKFCDVYAAYMDTYCSKSCCEKRIESTTPPPVQLCFDSAGVATCTSYSPFCNFPQVQSQCQKTCGVC